MQVGSIIGEFSWGGAFCLEAVLASAVLTGNPAERWCTLTGIARGLLCTTALVYKATHRPPLSSQVGR